ncbi:DEAD/DEAH box helicase [Rhizobium ruizarguesonis]|uniref:DEAD/DEAH box helicase n=1 Tax=Rhizobium ruizarguesonis TaxID=2081791 RepID=UPI001FDF35E8|nr:DEAD/DEAH box helicase [Rhizobium ruizarguesonis]
MNKHADGGIGELSGACDDARALWALFSDNLPDLESRLLLDESATLESSRIAVFDALAAAQADDVVILSFAGHGSANGRLVFSDTHLDDLDGTTLPMSELADAFSNSRARVVLCILDCCFSGQAPARVLETDGNPRSFSPFEGIFGEGRILLAACGPSESAWEQPGSGHGVLTYSILQSLTNPDLQSISFPEIAGTIVTAARVAAQQMGRTQTPEFLGHIAGGLVFPKFERGENFLAAFPESEILKVSGDFAEFEQFGFPAAVVENWKLAFPNGLNPLQLKAANDHGVLAGKSLLVVAPTSSGKTLIGEMASVHAVASGKKAVFLLPYRALVNEKYEDFSANYGAAGLRIARCSGDASDGVGPVLSGRYDIAFFTYEMFLNMALGSPRLLSQLGLVVLDEGQFITDPNRGITVELILAMLLRGQDVGINPQLLILSAVIGKLNGFDQWLDLPLLRTDVRPVPLIEGVLDRQGSFQHVGVDGVSRKEQLLDATEIRIRRDKPSSQDLIVPLAKKLVGKGEKLLVFRNVRGPAEGCAEYLAKELGLPPATNVLDTLPSQDLTSSSHRLRRCLEGGTAFHNTNLLRAERQAVERGYRNRDGGIHALAATTTLAAGINTPASTVILAENNFVGEDGRPFTVAEYKNMAGRAGRLGWNEIGKAIILADTPIERAQLFQKYVLGTPEDVRSSFQHKNLATWTVRLLSQVRGVRVDEIPQLLVNTFGGYTASRTNPDWVSHVSLEVSGLVKRMLDLGLAEMQGDLVHLTLLGRACGASSLSFDSSLRLVDLLRNFNTSAGALAVLALIQVLDEMDSTYISVFKKGRGESVRASDAAQRFGVDVMRSLQRFAADEFNFWQRCKRASILFDWLEGIEVEEIERRYSYTPFQGNVSYGDIIRVTDATRFHLRSAHQIFAAMFPEQPELLTQLAEMLDRLEFGLPAEALALRNVGTLSRGQYLTLYHQGCRSADDVDAISLERLVDLIGKHSAMLMRDEPEDA